MSSNNDILNDVKKPSLPCFVWVNMNIRIVAKQIKKWQKSSRVQLPLVSHSSTLDILPVDIFSSCDYGFFRGSK